MIPGPARSAGRAGESRVARCCRRLASSDGCMTVSALRVQRPRDGRPERAGRYSGRGGTTSSPRPRHALDASYGELAGNQMLEAVAPHAQQIATGSGHRSHSALQAVVRDQSGGLCVVVADLRRGARSALDRLRASHANVRIADQVGGRERRPASSQRSVPQRGRPDCSAASIIGSSWAWSVGSWADRQALAVIEQPAAAAPGRPGRAASFAAALGYLPGCNAQAIALLGPP